MLAPSLPPIFISHAVLTAPLERSTCPNQQSLISLKMRSRSSSSSFASSSLDLTVSPLWKIPLVLKTQAEVCVVLKHKSSATTKIKHKDQTHQTYDLILFNPIPYKDAFYCLCKQSRPWSGSSCKSCIIRVYSVCLWKYDISDPTLVGHTSNFFVLCTNMEVYLYNYPWWVEPSMNIHEGNG